LPEGAVLKDLGVASRAGSLASSRGDRAGCVRDSDKLFDGSAATSDQR